MKKLFYFLLSSIFISNMTLAGMSNSDKSKAWKCSGIYMANYFLPPGEKFEYTMKEHSMASVKVMKSYALEVGIKAKEWDDGVNKAVDESYGSKYSEKKTKDCDKFLNNFVPSGAERVKKVIQTLY